MDINEIIQKQKEFDSKHRSEFNWDENITDENLELLEFIFLSMVGEFGETSNIIKKIVRGDMKLEDAKGDIAEEIIDIFIYLIKLIYQLDIDFEKAYLAKMAKNINRFERYKKEDELF